MTNKPVELICGTRRETFDRFHATRILTLRNNGGWALPKDTEFTFSRKNGIRLKADKKRARDTEEVRDDKQG
jgi:hypothetical protein